MACKIMRFIISTILYSHSQWLFYEFISNFTNKLVKQSLRVTVEDTVSSVLEAALK